MPGTFYISFQSLGMSVSGFLILLREFFCSFLQKVLPGQHGHLLGNRLHKYIFVSFRVSLAMMPRAADPGHHVWNNILQQQWSSIHIHSNTHETVLTAHTGMFWEEAEFWWRRQFIVKISGGIQLTVSFVVVFLMFFSMCWRPLASSQACVIISSQFCNRMQPRNRREQFCKYLIFFNILQYIMIIDHPTQDWFETATWWPGLSANNEQIYQKQETTDSCLSDRLACSPSGWKTTHVIAYLRSVNDDANLDGHKNKTLVIVQV